MKDRTGPISHAAGLPRAIVSRWDAFWFAGVPPHLYALLRIVFGVLGLVSLAGLLDLALFWSCDGLVAARDGRVCEALAPAGLGWLPGQGVFWLAVVSFAAMTVGLVSRVAVLAAFASISLMAWWNDLPLSAAHQVLRAVLFCLIWADSGRVWSVDAWRRGGSRLPEAPAAAPAWPLRLIQIQVAAVYLVTGLWKLNNAMWRDGSAIHYVFENPQFRRFTWLAAPSLDPLTTLVTDVTLAWELSFALFVLWPSTRRLAVRTGIVMHLGMWATLELGPFPWIMLACLLTFLAPASLVHGARAIAAPFRRWAGEFARGGDKTALGRRLAGAPRR